MILIRMLLGGNYRVLLRVCRPSKSHGSSHKHQPCSMLNQIMANKQNKLRQSQRGDTFGERLITLKTRLSI